MTAKRMQALDIVQDDPDSPIGKIAQMLLWIAPHPEEVNLHVSEGYRKTLIEIDVPQTDIGKIIGRDGNTINALRTILYTSLGEDDPDFDVSIPDEKRSKRRRRRPTDRHRGEHEREEF